MLTFVEENRRFIAVTFQMIHYFLGIVLDLCNSPAGNEQPHMDKLHDLIHTADFVVQRFQIGKFVFSFDTLLHILRIHYTGTLFGHRVVDILLDLLLILRFNINRHDYIINIDDLSQPEFIYVFRVFVYMQDDLIAVAGFDQLFIPEGDTALGLYLCDKVLILL